MTRKRTTIPMALVGLAVSISGAYAQVADPDGLKEVVADGVAGVASVVTPDTRSSGVSDGPLTQIFSFTVPVTELDFDAMPQGATTVAAINAAFPAVDLVEIELTTPTQAAGVFNTNAFQRALAAHPNGSLDLYLVDPPSGQFGAFSAAHISLGHLATEFGFTIGDFNGPFNVAVRASGTIVAEGQFDAVGAPDIFLQSGLPFDEIVITLHAIGSQPAVSTGGNWVLMTLWIEDGTAVPTVVSEIPNFTVDISELDFDLMSAGPTTVDDINNDPAFCATRVRLQNLTLTPPTAPAGVYDVNTVGRALGGNPNGNLALHVIDNNGNYGAAGSLVVSLERNARQFGFNLGDYNGPVNVGLSLGGSLLADGQFDATGARDIFLAANVPFDEVTITLLAIGGQAQVSATDNWVVPSLWVEPTIRFNLREIPAFSVPMVELDFDLMSPGNRRTTEAEINAAFPGADIVDIDLTIPTAAPGFYNTNAFDRALGADPDFSLNLFLVDPFFEFDAQGSMIIDLGRPTTEFGFNIGDWNGPMNVAVRSGGSIVGEGTFNVAGAQDVFFAACSSFDEVELTLLAVGSLLNVSTGGNWVVPTMWIETGGACGTNICGDTNCDGVFNGGDIDSFFLALGDPAAWEAQFGPGGLGCDLICTSDINGSGAVNGADIDRFFSALGGFGLCESGGG